MARGAEPPETVMTLSVRGIGSWDPTTGSWPSPSLGRGDVLHKFQEHFAQLGIL